MELPVDVLLYTFKYSFKYDQDFFFIAVELRPLFLPRSALIPSFIQALPNNNLQQLLHSL